MSEPISICVVCRNRLLREGFSRLLDSSSTNVVCKAPDFESLDFARPDRDEQLYVFVSTAPGGFDLPFDALASFRNDYPQRKLIVMVSEIDGPTLGQLHDIGVEGCLTLDVSSKAFLAYLRLIQVGERVYSEHVAHDYPGLKNGKRQDFRLGQEGDAAAISLHTNDINLLRELVSGATNRQIARNLNLHEDTVKLNLKSLMKRIDVSNRTQAAIWAVRKGIVTLDNGIQHADRSAQC